ncbi:hypothetical protein H0H81_012409 [Sphagnurus paluster]|uniref:Uncharacterized protein n=1 Tax=Sphagnurus paluster TaxID=117069 RepID=A0A9P7FTU8_9AGAR|nr:hypothetical protein H0H81_012409 [Sphagnurus paluster]
MFKRVEKRRRKREEEEELGLDEDMKEILGMHDTDSEESASESDNSSDDERVTEVEGDISKEGNSDEEDLENTSEESAPEEEQPFITIKEALRDPVYLVSLLPIVIKGCIAHERRVKQFCKLAVNANPNDNAWDLLRDQLDNKSTSVLATATENSKRAQKRKVHAAIRKERREKQKAKVKAKKAAVDSGDHPTAIDSPQALKKKEMATKTPMKPSVSESITPTNPTKRLKKRPRVTPAQTSSTPLPDIAPEGNGISAPSAPVLPSIVSAGTVTTSIKNIARSATSRANLARARATNSKSKRTLKVIAAA